MPNFLVAFVLLFFLEIDDSVLGKLDDAYKALSDGDYATSLQICITLGKEGNPEAQYILGQMYYEGWGVDKDVEEAVKQFLMAAESGHPRACFAVGAAFELGIGVKKDFVKAVKWYRQHAESVAIGLNVHVAFMFDQSDLGPHKAVDRYRELAENDNVDAQFLLGLLYFQDYPDIPEDKEKTRYWLTKAAQKGDPVCQYGLGIFYAYGSGKYFEPAKAVFWLRKSAHLGHVSAQSTLGFKFRVGDGVDVNFKEALYWLELAAEQNDPFAQVNLATMYQNSEGVEQDLETAVYWYQKAASQGHPVAIKELEILSPAEKD